jgi:2-hydroxycyclohexanecarboxyl-CoA dehydrogenase
MSQHDPSSPFRDQVVIVTGGSSGIGKQVTRDLLAAGALVTLTGHDPVRVDAAHKEIASTFPQVDAAVCDVRDMGQVGKTVEDVLARRGRVDVLINNAGYAVYRPFEESSAAEVLDLLDVNLAGAMRMAKAVLPGMIARRSGRIVNIASIGGETVITPNAVYSAAKHGMVAWTKALRYELGRFGIRATVVCPGHTITHFHDDPTFRRRDPYRGRQSRSMSVERVSTAILESIRRDKIMTYVPAWLGLMAWALNALPFVTRPMWDRIANRRIEQLYEQIDAERHRGPVGAAR